MFRRLLLLAALAGAVAPPTAAWAWDDDAQGGWSSGRPRGGYGGERRRGGWDGADDRGDGDRDGDGGRGRGGRGGGRDRGDRTVSPGEVGKWGGGDPRGPRWRGEGPQGDDGYRRGRRRDDDLSHGQGYFHGGSGRWSRGRFYPYGVGSCWGWSEWRQSWKWRCN